MTTKARKNTFEPHRPLALPATTVMLVCLLVVFCTATSYAVTSKIIRHNSSGHFLKGKTENIVVGSKGTLSLGRATRSPAEQFQDVWSVNCIVARAGTIFIGTSPNGAIYKYSLGELEKIYPTEDKSPRTDSNTTVEEDQHLANEHIFAMAADIAGRILAGISGDTCRLLRLGTGQVETIFEPNDARYIFAIALDEKGNIYLGTGPEGKIYRYDPFNPDAGTVLYDSIDKNILSLAVGDDGYLYAGTDGRGLVYKIDTTTGSASVLYDADQPEITALALGKQGELYAAATSANLTQAETQFAAQLPLTGRPETAAESEPSTANGGGQSLKIPQTKDSHQAAAAQAKALARKPPQPTQASYIYRITKDGYVTDIFNEKAVFFTLTAFQDKLLVGSGNNGRLFSIDPANQQQAIVYQDEQASQITAVTAAGDRVYLGTANAAKLITLSESFAAEGTYTSDLVDAGQPAKWGKLQLEADIPPGCSIDVTCRSGNVQDVNDPTFSPWTPPKSVSGPVQLDCPAGRFCQYRLIFKTATGTATPVVRQVAVACTVPNIAPRVESVVVTRNETPNKQGTFKITYKAQDDNKDKLIYRIDFRKLGRTAWIKLKDKLEQDNYEWDARTVEDGRYEIRVTASDENSNTAQTKLTATRISDPVVVDNTAPTIKEYFIDKSGKTVTLRLHVADELSAVGKVEYTVDSSTDWKGTLPGDLVYDTTDENFTITTELEPGEHVIALKIADQVGNTTYKTFDVTIEND